MVLFFKKDDNALLKNYKPISLLSHVYKLFSRVDTNRVALIWTNSNLPSNLGSEQTLAPRTTYIRSASLLGVRGLRKSFWFEWDMCCTAVSPAMKSWLLVGTWKCSNATATMSVRLHDQNRYLSYLPQRGVRHGDVISLKLFTVALEDVFKVLDWKGLSLF